MGKLLDLVLRIGALLLSLVFVGVGIFLLCNPTAYDSQTTAEITKIESDGGSWDGDTFEENFTVYVRYEAGGKTYENIPLNSYSSSMQVGDTLEIQYNAAEPETIATTGFDILPIVLIAAGLIGAAVDVIGFLRSR